MFRASRGSVFLYAIMLSFFAVIVGYIVMLKMDTLVENLNIQNYDIKSHSNLTEKADLSIGYDILLRSDSGSANDDIARKTLYGYIKKSIGWYDTYLMNTPIRKYIANNPLNLGTGGVLPSNTQTGYIYLDVDNPYNLKVVEFKKDTFDTIKELEFVTGSVRSSGAGEIGWIMPDLSLSGHTATPSSRKAFDLKNKDYALFLSFSGNLAYTGVDFMKYKIVMENENGSGIYISPLGKTASGTVGYLGTDIIIDNDQNYRYKEFQIIREDSTLP